MKTSDKYKVKIREYYADPDNSPVSRKDLAKALGIARKTLYKHLSPAEMFRAENEGLVLRRERLGAVSASIDRALITKALEGDVSAIRLYFQRLEHWHERLSVSIEPTTDELRDLAVSLGHDPDTYVQAYNKLRRGDRI